MRRLFRDPDNKVLGGVASGLAAYMGWDVTWYVSFYWFLVSLFMG